MAGKRLTSKRITWTNARRKLSQLRAWEQNPVEIDEASARRLVESLDEFGQVSTIAIDPNGVVLDGNQRLRCWSLAQKFGADFVVDVRVASRELTDAEHRKLAILLRTSQGHFDWDALASWDPGDLQDWGLDSAILHQMELDALNLREMLASEEEQPAEVADDDGLLDRVGELQKKWGVKHGDLWEIPSKSVRGRAHRILCGDSTNAGDVKRLMQGEKAFVLADAPYGVGIVGEDGKIGDGGWTGNLVYAPIANDDSTETAKAFYATCCELGYSDFILFGGNYFTDFLPPRACWIVWDKREGTARNDFADCELAWTSFSTPARVYHHLWNGMIRRGNDGEKQVPTQKPVGLFADILRDFSKEQAIILDGFLGSGTTLIACENVGRVGRGIEIEPKYVAVALERLQSLGLEPKLVERLEGQ